MIAGRWPVIAAALTIGAAPAAMAVVPDENEFVFVSDLLERGFEPFGTSGHTETLFGMSDGSEIYLCYSVDSRSSRSPRQETLYAEMANEPSDNVVPNIAIACVLTQ